jgi:hypothetical protein
MIIFQKLTCLFFDQVNIYAKILCDSYAYSVPSTELSTDIVDKRAEGSLTDTPARCPAEKFPALLVEPEALS